MSLTVTEERAVRELVASVRALLGPELIEARLFGSRARGEGTSESDLDVAFIVTTVGRARRREVYDLAYDASLAHGVQLAPTVIEESRLMALRQGERLFARELDRDGIAL